MLSRLAALALLPPILTVEAARAYGGLLLRRNLGSAPVRLVRVTRDDGEVELLPVCSCCRMRAMRPRGTGRICPTCDLPAPSPADMPERRPPAHGD